MALNPFAPWRTANTRQKAALPIIKRGVREGLTHSRIEQALRSQGLGIRHEIMRAYIRVERAAQAYGKSMRTWPRKRQPVAKYLPEYPGKLSRKYLFTLEVRTEAVDTGALTSRYLSISTNQRLSPEDLESTTRTVFEDRRGEYGVTVSTVTPTEAWKASQEGTV